MADTVKTKIFIDGSEGTTGLRIYERFEGRDDIELLTLGSYFAELLESVTGEGVPEPELLRLPPGVLLSGTDM